VKNNKIMHKMKGKPKCNNVILYGACDIVSVTVNLCVVICNTSTLQYSND